MLCQIQIAYWKVGAVQYRGFIPVGVVFVTKTTPTDV